MRRKITDVESNMLKKLQEISNADEFLYSFVVYLETDEERKFVMNALDKGRINDSAEAVMLAINIYRARKANNGQGNYLKMVKFPNR